MSSRKDEGTPATIHASYTYDAVNRLDLLTINKVAGQTATELARFDYVLGRTPKRKGVTEFMKTRTPMTPDVNRTVNYSYDLLNRLTKEEIAVGAPNGTIIYDSQPGYTDPTGFGFDRVGNRRSRTVSPPELADAGVSDFSNRLFDENDRFKDENEAQLDEFGYDANGNTKYEPLPAAVVPPSNLHPDEYDFENRLIKRYNGAVTVRFQYDGDGNRVRKVVEENTVVTKITYMVDDLNPTGYAQVLSETTEQGSATASIRYAYGHDLITATKINYAPGDPVTHWYGHDGHGSVRFMVSHDGQTISDFYVYDAFGIPIDGRGETVNDYLYAGEQFDQHLGLYYVRARYLNPNTGRFGTRDSFEGSPEDPGSLHIYLYAQADPVNGIDPLGMYTQADGFAAEAAIREVYDIDHPLDRMRHGRWTRLGPPSGPAYRLKPDIFNRTTQRWGEIKPFSYGGIVEALAQYTTYMAAFSPYSYWPDAAWKPSTHFAYAGTLEIFFFNAGGIIFYTDALDMEEDAPPLITIALARAYFLKNKVRLGDRSLVGGALRNVPKMSAARVGADRARLQIHVGIASLLAAIGGAFIP